MKESEKKRSSIQTDYISRINRVLDYIGEHLGEDLTLDTLAHIACFSRFHFHRIFYSVTGERLAACIQRLRLEKAASLLRTNHDDSITDIALTCGFASSASFANAFKRYFGTAASLFRIKKQSISKKDYILLSNEARESLSIRIKQHADKLSYHIKGDGYKRIVDIVELPSRNVAYIRYTGPYKGDTQLFDRLWTRMALWAAPRGLLSMPDTVFLTLCHDDPEITMEEKLRISICISIDETTITTGEVGKMKLPGGTYAVCRFLLGSGDYPAAWGWMYGTWLPVSGYQPDDRIAFEQFFPQQQQVSDGMHHIAICIPVKPAC